MNFNSFRNFLLFLILLTACPASAKEDCSNKYRDDKYAQCVCACQNKFEDDVIRCPTAPCIGAANIARTACISKCNVYEAGGGGVGSREVHHRDYYTYDFESGFEWMLIG